VAVLATYRGDGSVLLSPVRHQWRDGGFDVICLADDVELRHLRRDTRALLLVYDNEPPHRGVELRRTAQLREIDPADARRDIAVR
jgi:hypothetical protein